MDVAAEKHRGKIARRTREEARARRAALLAAERDVRAEERARQAEERRAERAAMKEEAAEQARLRRERAADLRRAAAIRHRLEERDRVERKVLSLLRYHAPVLAPAQIRSILDAHAVSRRLADEAIANLVETARILEVGAGARLRYVLTEPGAEARLLACTDCPAGLRALLRRAAG
jgi:hypothetical protein